MKPILLINIVNLVLLIGLVVLYVVFGFPMWFLALFAAWIVYIVIINIYLLKTEDIKSKLIAADSREEFKGYVKAICNAIDSVEFYRNTFKQYAANGNVRQAFDAMSKKAYLNADRAYQWIKSYNYLAEPSHEYIIRLAEDSYQITQDLAKMNDLLIKASTSSEAVDMTSANEFIADLKRSTENWKYD